MRGTDVIVNYGKLGTDGQTQVKNFSSAGEAEKAAGKLRAEKTKKGYVETLEEVAKEMKVEAKKYALSYGEAVSGSRFPVGSSAINIDGLFTNALASATLCCSPPDNSFGYTFALSERPTIARTIGTCLLICFGVALTIYIAKATFS